MAKKAKSTAKLYARGCRILYSAITDDGKFITDAEEILRKARASKAVLNEMIKMGMLKKDGNAVYKIGNFTPKDVETKIFNSLVSSNTVKAIAKKVKPVKVVAKPAKKKAMKKVAKKTRKAAHGPTATVRAPKKTARTKGNTQESYSDAIESIRKLTKSPKQLALNELSKKFKVSSHLPVALMNLHLLTNPKGNRKLIQWNGGTESSNHLAIKVINYISDRYYKKKANKSKPKNNTTVKPKTPATKSNVLEELALEWQGRGRHDIALQLLRKK